MASVRTSSQSSRNQPARRAWSLQPRLWTLCNRLYHRPLPASVARTEHDYHNYARYVQPRSR